MLYNLLGIFLIIIGIWEGIFTIIKKNNMSLVCLHCRKKNIKL